MVQLEPRELVPFPAGDNASDVLINGEHFNRTALQLYQYALWTNGTLSNESDCYLVFDNFHPILYGNGSVVNGTSCYVPFYHIRQRGILGIVLACLFATSIVFSCVNLRKHGRLFLPTHRRFRAIGRRWQWYWVIVTAACATISGFMSIDVDRDYLQALPIVLQNFFYFLMTPAILAAIWESVRHWGSWQERQIYDRDNFLLRDDDLRARKEFYMPLVFYLFDFMNFFMTIPRSWTAIEDQHSPEQQRSSAKPSATDGRFKAGAIFAFCAWLVICYALHHAIHHYHATPQASRSILHSVAKFFRIMPSKFMLVIPFGLVVVGYAFAIAWEWNISPLRSDARPAWFYGLGYSPILLIIVIFQIYGYRDKNEDRILLSKRRDRERAVDAELGFVAVRKPDWWSKRSGGNSGGHHGGGRHDDDEAMNQLKNMIHSESVGGGPATHHRVQRALQLRDLSSSSAAAATTTTTNNIPSTPSSTASTQVEANRNGPLTVEVASNPFADHQRHDIEFRSDNGSERSSSLGTMTSSLSSSQQPPTRIRSMLDV